jgi:hypothetical protein
MTKPSIPRSRRSALRVLRPGGAALLGLGSGKKAVKVAGNVKLTKRQLVSMVTKRSRDPPDCCDHHDHKEDRTTTT